MQKNISNEAVSRAGEIGERMLMDISSIKNESTGGAMFWALFMGDHSKFLINRFKMQKSDLVKARSMLIKGLEDQHGIKIKIINILVKSTTEKCAYQKME